MTRELTQKLDAFTNKRGSPWSQRNHTKNIFLTQFTHYIRKICSFCLSIITSQKKNQQHSRPLFRLSIGKCTKYVKVVGCFTFCLDVCYLRLLFSKYVSRYSEKRYLWVANPVLGYAQRFMRKSLAWPDLTQLQHSRLQIHTIRTPLSSSQFSRLRIVTITT